MKTPDITRAQLIAVVVALMNFLTTLGIPISVEQADALRDLLDTMLIVVGADAVIRFGRNLRK